LEQWCNGWRLSPFQQGRAAGCGEATKKSIPGKTPKGVVSEKSGSRSGEKGFAGLLDGQFGADDAD
jgi:hypothetical protein